MAVCTGWLNCLCLFCSCSAPVGVEEGAERGGRADDAVFVGCDVRRHEFGWVVRPRARKPRAILVAISDILHCSAPFRDFAGQQRTGFEGAKCGLDRVAPRRNLASQLVAPHKRPIRVRYLVVPRRNRPDEVLASVVSRLRVGDARTPRGCRARQTNAGVVSPERVRDVRAPTRHEACQFGASTKSIPCIRDGIAPAERGGDEGARVGVIIDTEGGDVVGNLDDELARRGVGVRGGRGGVRRGRAVAPVHGGGGVAGEAREGELEGRAVRDRDLEGGVGRVDAVGAFLWGFVP